MSRVVALECVGIPDAADVLVDHLGLDVQNNETTLSRAWLNDHVSISVAEPWKVGRKTRLQIWGNWVL